MSFQLETINHHCFNNRLRTGEWLSDRAAGLRVHQASHVAQQVGACSVEPQRIVMS